VSILYGLVLVVGSQRLCALKHLLGIYGQIIQVHVSSYLVNGKITFDL
jgi:hypothetical protein